MHRMKYIVFIFVTILTFVVVFFRVTAVQYQTIQKNFVVDSHRVILPISADEKSNNTLKKMNKLQQETGLEFVKTDVDAETNNTKLYLLTKQHSKFDQRVLGFAPSVDLDAKTKMVKSNMPLSGLTGEMFVGSLNHMHNKPLLSGEWFVKGDKKYTKLELAKLLENRLDISRIRVLTPPKKIHIDLSLDIQLGGVLVICTVLLILVFVYNFFLSYQSVSLKSLFGYSKFQLMLASFQDIWQCLWILPITVLPLAFLPIVIWQTTGYWAVGIVVIETLGWILATVCLAMLIVSIFLIPYRVNVADTKGKAPIKIIYIVNWGVKISLMFILIFSSQSALHATNQALILQHNRALTRKVLKGYSYTPNRTQIDIDQNDNVLVTEQAQTHTALFKVLYQAHKLLLFNPSDETNQRLQTDKPAKQQNGIDNLVYISPEYLNQVPIVDIHGKRVEVNANRKTGLVLIPWNLRHNIVKIKAKMTAQHQWDEYDSTKGFAEHTNFRTNKSIVPKLTYRYIKVNQRLVCFYGYLAELQNPILFVVTPYMSNQPYSTYAVNFAGQSETYFFKNSRQQPVQKTIKKLGITEEFPQVLSARTYTDTWYRDAWELVWGNLGIMMLLILTATMVSLFAVKTYLIIYQDTIFIKKITGYGYSRIIGKFLLSNVVLWVICLIYYALQGDALLIKFYALLGVFDVGVTALVGQHFIRHIKGDDL